MDTKDNDTLIALECLVDALLRSIALKNPDVADQCATELAELQERLPPHLPASAEAVSLKLAAWEQILNTRPTPQRRKDDPFRDVG